MNFLGAIKIDDGDEKFSYHERWKVQRSTMMNIDKQLLWISWVLTGSMLNMKSSVTMSDEKIQLSTLMNINKQLFWFSWRQAERLTSSRIDVGNEKLSDHERWKVQLLRLVDLDLQLCWISSRSAWSMLEVESWVTMSDEKFNFWDWLILTSNFCEFLRGKLERLTSGGTTHV